MKFTRIASLIVIALVLGAVFFAEDAKAAVFDSAMALRHKTIDIVPAYSVGGAIKHSCIVPILKPLFADVSTLKRGPTIHRHFYQKAQKFACLCLEANRPEENDKEGNEIFLQSASKLQIILEKKAPSLT